MACLMSARSCHIFTLVMVLAVVPHTYAQQTCPFGIMITMNEFPDELSSLVQFINQAGITDKINKTDGNFTFVAPNNNAFNTFNVTLQQNNLTFADLTDKNDNRAASIILYHMIPGAGSMSFNNLTGQSVPTMLEGHNLTISNVNKSVTFIGEVNNATPQKVYPPEIDSCGSLIFIVDHVLLPNATLTSIPAYVASGASSLAIAGQWAFALSSVLGAALLL